MLIKVPQNIMISRYVSFPATTAGLAAASDGNCFSIPVITFGFYQIQHEKECDWKGSCGHAIYTMGIGGYLIVSGILGFFGALRRKNRWLVIYSILIAILCVVELVMGVLNYILGSKNQYDFRSHLTKPFEAGEVDGNPVVDTVKDLYNNQYVAVLYDAATGEYNIFNIVTLLTGTTIFQLWIAEMAFVYSCLNDDPDEY
nr:hypothetical protein HmN_000806900 [Hymenolepis microstoma]